MRILFGLMLCLATPCHAETILAGSKITDVTVYPQGAKLTRVVEFTAPAGLHDLLITDLPQDTDPQSLRLVAADGVTIGAYALRSDRLPPRNLVKSPERLAAEEALEAAATAVNAAQIGVDGVQARVDAAQAQIAYLGRLGATDAKSDTDVLQSTAQMIGAEVLAASQAALAARADLPALQKVLRLAIEAQADAQQALDALGRPAAGYTALSLAFAQADAGPRFIEITQYVGNAGWAPIYDAALDRKAGQVVLDRSLLVSQATGEDWTGVALTLSTAQPGNATVPANLWPQLHRIDDPAPMPKATARMAASAPMDGVEMDMAPAPVAEASVAVAYQGDIVSYAYPNPVTIADGAENLRLSLDTLVLPATAQAHAVPRYDATAFVMADFTNDSGQILLPGPAVLTRDGALVGGAQLDSVAPGAKVTLGFGAIDGLRLKRIIPARAEGDRGLFSKSNQIEETAVLSVENLTAEDWAVRVMEGMPYSEQEDLSITFTADPPASEQDVDGKRGVLAWDLTVPAGKTQEITLATRESWPDGKVLNGQQY